MASRSGSLANGAEDKGLLFLREPNWASRPLFRVNGFASHRIAIMPYGCHGQAFIALYGQIVPRQLLG